MGIGQGARHPHKAETGADCAIGIKAEHAILVGPLPLQAPRQIFAAGQPVQIGHFGQFGPVADKEDHQVAAHLGVGVRDRMAGMGKTRADDGSKDVQTFIGQAEDDRGDRAAPSCTKIAAVLAGKQIRNLFRRHLRGFLWG